MSRLAQPSEKIMAVAGIYRALWEELPEGLYIGNEVVQAALIDASVKIAMSTDTHDMGILRVDPVQRRANELAAELQRDDPI